MLFFFLTNARRKQFGGRKWENVLTSKLLSRTDPGLTWRKPAFVSDLKSAGSGSLNSGYKGRPPAGPGTKFRSSPFSRFGYAEIFTREKEANNSAKKSIQ